MAIKMVREPSATPNINNVDDIIPMRYAYGNQNGYVIGKGTEISNTINGSNFIVNSGRLVLQGVECDIDASGVTIAVDNIATKRYYTVYLQVNLATNQVAINSEYNTVDYPVIDSGDDLTENSSGIARMVLYNFTAQNGIINQVSKLVTGILYINKDFIENTKINNSYNSDLAKNSNKVQNVDFSDNNVSTFGEFVIPKKITVLESKNGIRFESNSLDISDTGLRKGDWIEMIIAFGSSKRSYKIQVSESDNISHTGMIIASNGKSSFYIIDVPIRFEFTQDSEDEMCNTIYISEQRTVRHWQDNSTEWSSNGGAVILYKISKIIE